MAEYFKKKLPKTPLKTLHSVSSKGNKPVKIILKGFLSLIAARLNEGLSGAHLICTFLLKSMSAV